jgi:hypothetical protein
MKNCLVAAVLALACAGASAATYGFTAPTYNAFYDFPGPCTEAPCANFTAAMQVQGSFSTAANLAANLAGAEITPLVTGYSFSDGLTAYGSADPQSRLVRFFVSTDATGAITMFDIEVQRWRSPGPHAGNDRVDTFLTGPGGTSGAYNLFCPAGGVPSVVNGVADTCSGTGYDDNSSDAGQNVAPLPVIVPPPPPAVPAAVPALGGWVALVLALAMAASGVRAIRR